MNWLTTTIGEVCLPTFQCDPAGTRRKSFSYVDIAGIDTVSKSISKVDEVLSNNAPSRARKIIQETDVLVSTVRPNLNAIALVPKSLDDEIASTGFAVLRANQDLIDPKYLFYWAQSKEFVNFLVANASGASFPAVSDRVIKLTPIPLAPLKEQSRIVELLDEADRLRRQRREADTKAARILPALFLRFFGDPTTNPKGLPVKLLGDPAICGINPGTKIGLEDSDLVSFLTMADVDEVHGGITVSQTRPYGEVKKGFTSFHDNDVLFAKITPYMQNGKVAIASGLVGGVGFGSTEFHVLRAGADVTSEYLFALTRLQSFKNHAMSAFTGPAGQHRVPTDFLSQYRLPVPTAADLLKFSNVIRQLLRCQMEADKAIEKLEALFQLLVQQAFSGVLTARWREANMLELVSEMVQQTSALNLHLQKELEVLS